MVKDLQRPERLELRSVVRLSFLALAAALIATPCGADAPASSPHNVPEPQGLYQGALHGYVPATLKGATVLDTAGLETLIRDAQPALVDVAEKDRKPPSMSKDMIWLPQHRSIPGAVWLPGAGAGTEDAAFAAAFRNRAVTLAMGKPATPIVVFCHPDCWASYNAAKRLVALGYSQVYWYPAGMEGWQDRHDTAVVKPDKTWLSTLPKSLTQ